MEKYDYAPLNTTLSVLETELLSESDFSSLLSARSLEDALNILDKTVYEIPADVSETKNFEGFLNRRLRQITQNLAGSILDASIIGIFTRRYTYHNLKVLTKASQLDKNLDHMLINMGMPIEQLKAFLNTGDGQNIPSTMVETTREVRAILEAGGDLGNIDVIYDRAYLRRIKEIATDADDEQLIETTNMIIDLENLSTLLRAMRQDKSKAFVRGILSDAGAIPVEDLVEHWEHKDFQGLLDSYRSTPYGNNIEDILKERGADITDPVAVDAAIYEEKAAFYRQFSLEPFGPMPVISYLHFLNNEANNIRLILIGKDNGVPNETIKERMRPIYGI